MSTSPTILVLNGPNLNMLGVREPKIYGHETLDDIRRLCEEAGSSLGLSVDFRQSNIEGEMISIIQAARGTAAGIVINAAGYTHTSVAIQDALKLTDLPVIELHLSNTHKREPFRHKSFISAVAVGIIAGFGSHGYVLSLEAMAKLLKASS